MTVLRKESVRQSSEGPWVEDWKTPCATKYNMVGHSDSQYNTVGHLYTHPGHKIQQGGSLQHTSCATKYNTEGHSDTHPVPQNTNELLCGVLEHHTKHKCYSYKYKLATNQNIHYTTQGTYKSHGQ